MKKQIAIFSLVLSLGLMPPAESKAYYPSRHEMIQKAQLIAVVDIGPVTENAGYQGSHWQYSEKAQAKVLKVIKGKVESAITVCAGENFICARNHFKTGKHLVSLNKDKDVWSGAAWDLSFLPIKDDSVLGWPSKPESRHHESAPAKMEQVLADIKHDLATPLELANLSYPLDSLYTARRFCDGTIGEAATSPPEYEAYLKALRGDRGQTSTLKLLCKHATPAGRIYAACILYDIDKTAGQEALRTLAEADAAVEVHSGCDVFQAKLMEIAKELLAHQQYGSIKLAK